MAHPVEEDRVVDFFAANPDPYVKERDPEDEIVPAMTAGAVFIIEELDFGQEDRKIVASSAVYDPYDEDWDAWGASFPFNHWEFGSSLVVQEYRGLHLHTLLHHCRLCFVSLRHDPKNDKVFCTIAPTNLNSKRSAQKVGFRPWACTYPEILKRCFVCPKRKKSLDSGRQCCVDFFEFPDTARYRDAAVGLRQGDRVLGASQDPIRLYIDLDFLSSPGLRRQLDEIVQQGV
jgi:RimJ/RimL family protein N-acetyltransferase